LLKHSKIDKLFLPYFYKDPNLYSNVFKASLIINNIKPYTQAYNIALELYDIDVNYNSSLQENNIEKIFIDNTKEVKDCENWKFYFYNQRISDTDIQYLNHEIGMLIGNKSIEDYVAEVKGSCNDLKKIFEKITSNHNLTSLVLMHWNESYPRRKTLLTGDVRFDDELRERVFNDIKGNDKITLQVPHHGALKEWESLWEPSKNIATTDDIKAQIESFVFSFGQKNSYHHPYGRILVELLQDSSTKNKIKFVYEATPFEYQVP
jgi:hypothetical protein